MVEHTDGVLEDPFALCQNEEMVGMAGLCLWVKGGSLNASLTAEGELGREGCSAPQWYPEQSTMERSWERLEHLNH